MAGEYLCVTAKINLFAFSFVDVVKKSYICTIYTDNKTLHYMRILRITLILLMFAGIGRVYAQMTDDQIIEYVTKGMSAGKSQAQIARELLANGVRINQLQQLKNRLQGDMSITGTSGIEQMTSVNETRLRTGDAASGLGDAASGFGGSASMSPLSLMGTNSVFGYSDPLFGGSSLFGESYLPLIDSSMLEYYKPIYGHQIFNSPALSFEPNENLPTPANYKLGPGDEIIIDVWGASEVSVRQVISPDGDVVISQIGPIYLSGLTVQEAEKKLRKAISVKYDIDDENASSDIRVSLGQMRSIRVNIMGEVSTPGSYRMSSFASLFHALYNAGGITSIGSLRDIKVLRNGREIASADIYEFLFNGKLSTDIRLQEDDVIVVPPYSVLVSVEGEMKRPMYYELKKGETLSDLIKYAGGFTGNAYTGELQIVRGTGRVHTMLSVPEEAYASTAMEDGDVVTAGAILDRFDNRVEVKGAVYREGMYELSDRVSTVRRLVTVAEGVKDDAFLSRALLTRRKDDFTFEMISLDLEGILQGRIADVALMPDDVLFIPSKYEITERGDFTIRGMVAHPGKYPYVENMTVEDLILQAGGLQDGASAVKIEIARRKKDPKSTEQTSSLGDIFIFDMRDGYVVDNGEKFYLEPYDVVQVRRSPAYQPQRNVTVEGEVVFSGDYSLIHKNERLSDIIKRAGGVTNDAYVHGARLIRKLNDDEIAMRDAMVKMASRSAGRDSVSTASLNLADTYTVGIELDKALENPGSDFDMVLREGDRLVIPEKVSTVRIDGAVMYPNTVLYQSGKKLKYYISQAGGYANRAKRGKAYIIYMNGTVARVNRSKGASMMEPGCEIIIPRKPNGSGMSLAEILSISTTAASLGTMAASMANILK